MDTFPGLQQDALDAIRKANAVILKARELRAHCASGNPVEVREACKAISDAGKDLGDFCEAFALTTGETIMAEFHPEHVPGEGDEFFQGYMKAAEWLLDDNSPPEEGGIDRDAIMGWSPAAIADALGDCQAFQEANAADIARYAECYRPKGEYTPEKCAGHDFWLSRNGHGAGFFDRGNDPVFTRLQAAARVWSSRDAYLGDDGFLYFS